MPKKVHECVKKLMEKQGYKESKAWAICTASIEGKDERKTIKDVSIPALDKFIDETTGFLHVKGVLARTGVQEYLGRELSDELEPDKLYGVLRHPDDILLPESVEGYRNAPVTDDHPGDFVTSDNYNNLMRGSCSEVSQYKDQGIDYIKGHLTIMDKNLVEKLKDGKLEISAGYYSNLEREEGEYLGTPYHFRQKNIKINHVAIVSRGRCGGECRIVNDYGIIGDENKQTEVKSMAKLKIDGEEYEVPEKVASAYGKMSEKANGIKKDMEEEKKETEKAKATADELRTQLEDAKKKTSDVDVIGAAKAIASVKAIADSMEIEVELGDEHSMKKAVLSKKYPDLDLMNKSAAYIDARFDVMEEGRKAAATSHKKIGDEAAADSKHTESTKLSDSIKDEEY